VLATDITEQLKAKQELKVSEKKFKALIQNSSDLVAILDLHGKYLYVNQTSKRILGVAPEDFIGKSAFDFIYEQDKHRVMSEFELLATEHTVKISAFRFKAKHNEYRWIESIATNMAADPAVGGIVVNSRDVSERIENERKAQQSIERYNIVSKATSDAIYDYDIYSGIVNWNKAIKGLFGYKGTEFHRDWWKERVHPDDLNNVLNTIALAIKQRKSRVKIEYRFKCAKNNFKNVLDRAFLIYNKSGGLSRIIGSMEDITEHVTHLETVEAQNKRLKEIAWTQSHIVRTPLANIMGIVDLLLSEAASESENILLSQLASSALSLDKIIRDIVRKTETLYKFENNDDQH
jgi:PAS domain S-box-containing protein